MKFFNIDFLNNFKYFDKFYNEIIDEYTDLKDFFHFVGIQIFCNKILLLTQIMKLFVAISFYICFYLIYLYILFNYLFQRKKLLFINI